MSTHDFKNGSPRLQLYKNPPSLGGSVAVSADVHFGVLEVGPFVCEELVDCGRAKSRGSIGKEAPPIWKVKLCDTLQSNVPSDSEVSCDMICDTTSFGPRISEFPCDGDACQSALCRLMKAGCLPSDRSDILLHFLSL